MQSPTEHYCKYCHRPAKLARREYQVAGQNRYHVGAWCDHCERFTLPWLKQTAEHKALPIADVEDMVAIRDLINPALLH